MSKRLRVAYVTTYDSNDVHAWSGAGFYIRQSLENAGCDVLPVSNLKVPLHCKPILKFKTLLHSKIARKQYHFDREPAVLRAYAAQTERALRRVECDVVFAPSSLPLAYLKTDKHVAYWTDATFGGMIDFYPEFSNLCGDTIRNGHRAEQQALSRCRMAIFSSRWAAESARRNYRVAEDRIRVVPFGANIESTREQDSVSGLIECRGSRTCRLLFVGVDWYRKGGDVAMRTAEMLNQRGIPTELHVVGCTPPMAVPKYMRLHGFLSKKTPSGRQTLTRLFSRSHFLILPSRAECFGIVCAEASSFGIPVLAARVGGLPDAVIEGRNGFTYDPAEDAEPYCRCIAKLWNNRQVYDALAYSSFAEYSERLNWLSAGKKVAQLLRECCAC